MAHKTLINGTVYDISGGSTLVNGTAYKISSGRTLVGGTGYTISFGLSPVFANNSWAAIIAACQANEVPDTWSVGDSKPMNINGIDYPIDIIGKNHDSYTDRSGTAPLTFQMHDLYSTRYEMNDSSTNEGGYSGSDMHTKHLPSILNGMPAEVRAAIKQVDKKASYGNESTRIETIACKLFLLAEIEFFGVIEGSVRGEGSQYAYYKAGNSVIKYQHASSSPGNHWTRSPTDSGSKSFIIVRTTGGVENYYANLNGFIDFAFCF